VRLASSLFHGNLCALVDYLVHISLEWGLQLCETPSFNVVIILLLLLLLFVIIRNIKSRLHQLRGHTIEPTSTKESIISFSPKYHSIVIASPQIILFIKMLKNDQFFTSLQKHNL
jgi:hypothetical protein